MRAPRYSGFRPPLYVEETRESFCVPAASQYAAAEVKRIAFLTRAHIRAPFYSEIISLEVKSSDTIDNVKAKTDSMKAKIQDEED
jgi:hypothetical protein